MLYAVMVTVEHTCICGIPNLANTMHKLARVSRHLHVTLALVNCQPKVSLPPCIHLVNAIFSYPQQLHPFTLCIVMVL